MLLAAYIGALGSASCEEAKGPSKKCAAPALSKEHSNPKVAVASDGPYVHDSLGNGTVDAVNVDLRLIDDAHIELSGEPLYKYHHTTLVPVDPKDTVKVRLVDNTKRARTLSAVSIELNSSKPLPKGQSTACTVGQICELEVATLTFDCGKPYAFVAFHAVSQRDVDGELDADPLVIIVPKKDACK